MLYLLHIMFEKCQKDVITRMVNLMHKLLHLNDKTSAPLVL